MRIAAVLIILGLLSACATVTAQPTPVFTLTFPTLPRANVDTTKCTDTTGYVTKTVKASGGDFNSLQTAVNDASVKNAVTGVVLQVDAGFSKVENVVLPVHMNSPKCVVIRTAAFASLPSRIRQDNVDTEQLFRITTRGGNTPAISTATGVSVKDYRIIGLESTTQQVDMSEALVKIGDPDETVCAKLPDNIILDRVYLHGTTTASPQRATLLDGTNLAVINSSLSNIRTAGFESKANLTTQGQGPYLWNNNELQADSINIMWGGQRSNCGTHAKDITFTNNYVWKDPSWNHRSFFVKNLFEIKNAERVLVEGNVFRYSWPIGQRMAIVIKSAGGGRGCAPSTCSTSDVTFRYNVIADAYGWLLITHDPDGDVGPDRVHVHDNLFIRGGSGGGADFIQVYNVISDIIVDHNTAADQVASPGGPWLGVEQNSNRTVKKPSRLTVTNNVGPAGAHQAVKCSGWTDNRPSLDNCISGGTSGYVFTNNVTTVSNCSNIPAGNFCGRRSQPTFAARRTGGVNGPLRSAPSAANPAVTDAGTAAAGGFTLPYCLAAGSPYIGVATDGADLGVDCVMLSHKVRGVSPLY